MIMPLLRLDTASLHYGTQVLLDNIDFSIGKGTRLGLLGRNGVGKTTLLKVLAGEIIPESGEHWMRPGTRLAWLRQTLPDADEQTVYDVVASGLAEQRVESTISQLQLPGEAKMATLSGGWRRRVALAQALVSDPDVLLLDEPTNHLDIPAIQWLEEQLRQFNGAIILITHDRRFLQNVANTIAELDRGKLTVWQGHYQGFLEHREQQLKAEESANKLFDKRLAEEEVWIRQGIKARRTRNEGRVRALEAMREERSARRERTGTATFSAEDASKSGKIVAELKSVAHSFGDNTIIKRFSTIIQRGDRIGIVGSNGAGKSTLVKILLGELEPEAGEVKLGSKLEIAYSDQLRGHLDPESNLIDNVCGGQEFIDINGKRKHAISYLGDFLFSPERVRTPVKALSGGEQNRAILAKLFSKPANLLVLDEPTNDLDIETLELLEEILMAFDGTVLLVSHDRDFMDKVVTSLIVLEGDGVVSEHVGGYSDWQAHGGRLIEAQRQDPGSSAPTPDSNGAPATVVSTKKARKLSYKEQRELAALPDLIDELEQAQLKLEATMAEPGFYQSSRDQVAAVTDEISSVQTKLEDAIARWAELEE
ncbi:UNVERIFIED_CONTAM: hypothetical protein GTU68_035103 [Idotea baltica]|nr:hypothetical protein [Idotea baltica]